MNDVERVFHEDLQRNVFAEVMADDIIDDDLDMANEDDDTSSTAEEI